jgi:hypothetical protein
MTRGTGQDQIFRWGHESLVATGQLMGQ